METCATRLLPAVIPSVGLFVDLQRSLSLVKTYASKRNKKSSLHEINVCSRERIIGEHEHATRERVRHTLGTHKTIAPSLL